MDEKKKILDDVAHEIFAKNGYKNTNISEIAKESGISVGSFYKYYNSKEEIFLQVYVQENENIRKTAIQEINWEADPLEIILVLFDYFKEKILNNKILSEWNNPKIHDLLSKYYLSEVGKSKNSFNQFIISYVKKYLLEEGYSDKEINKIIKAYNLIYFIDCNVKEEDFPEKYEALEVLLTYSVQGLLSSRKK